MFTKAPPAPTFEQRWSVWAAGFGGSQTTDGNAVIGSNNSASSIYGIAVGADYRVSPNTLAGFALAGGGTSFNVNGLGYGSSDLFQAGAFVRHTIGAAYIIAALAYGWQDITTNRIVTVAGIDQLRAQFNANAWSGRVGGRLSLRHAEAGRSRHHALTPQGSSPPSICRPMPNSVVAGSPMFALDLCRQERHRHAQRARHSHRQILRDAGRHRHAARPPGLGA